MWLSWLRDALLIAEGTQARLVNRDRADELHAAAGSLDSRQLQAAIRSVQRVRWQVDSSVNSRIALEVLMLRLPILPQQIGSAV